MAPLTTAGSTVPLPAGSPLAVVAAFPAAVAPYGVGENFQGLDRRMRVITSDNQVTGSRTFLRCFVTYDNG
jgi:hypothetical protein